KHRVDVVHVTERPRQTLFGLFVPRLARLAGVLHAHTWFYPHDATRLSTLRLGLADAVIGVSQFTARTFVDNARLDPVRVFAVHNGVDTAIFTPEAALAGRRAMRERLGIPTDAPVVGCVARLMRWKGQATLLEAFVGISRRFPGALLVLAGSSSD